MKRIIFIFILVLGFVALQAQEKYVWSSLPVGGAGFASGIITSPQEKELIYVRTDVGGAYRWIAETQSWKPLTDWLGEDKVSYMGVESMAVDPQAPNKLYMYCGTTYWNSGRSAILFSEDYGETFVEKAIVTAQFPAHGNDDGRQSGERLAVDPNLGNILLCGSRNRGLWKSENSGETWTRLDASIFPNNRKIAFVQYVPSSTSQGNPTPEIYVGLLYKGGNNLFVSTDGGATWNPVAGQTTDYMPHRCLLSNGKLYLTYIDSEGPNTGGTGAIKKYNLTTQEWTDISPGNFSFGEVSVDPENPDALVATSLSIWRAQSWISGGSATYGDQIFISTDDGAHWKNLFSPLSVSYVEPIIEWLKKSSQLHWAGSVKIDPFNRNRAFITSGNGVYTTENLWDSKPVFKMALSGLEETVPNELVSLPGAPVVTVIADYDGFIYPDITTYYNRHTPSIGSTTGLGIAGKNPQIMMRAGSEIYLTENGGNQWNKLSKPVSDAANGWCAVSADGKILVATPSGKRPYYTLDKGASWVEMPGITSNNIRFFADYEQPDVFYAYVSNNLRTYTYQAASNTFEYTSAALPGAYNNRLTVTPEIAGEIWVPKNTGGLGRIRDAHTANPQVGTIALSMVTCVGVGKAAPGKTYPALYIWGKPQASDPVGLYRSDDEGQMWVRINDDQHQFGGAGNAQLVKGDMNVYGRVYMSTVGRGIIYGEISSGTPIPIPDNRTSGDIKLSRAAGEIVLLTTGKGNYKIYSIAGILQESGFCEGNTVIGRRLNPCVYIAVVNTQPVTQSIKFVK
jgi:photosystem II stability/assembly factor-like uncharacterized protein